MIFTIRIIVFLILVPCAFGWIGTGLVAEFCNWLDYTANCPLPGVFSGVLVAIAWLAAFFMIPGLVTLVVFQLPDRAAAKREV